MGSAEIFFVKRRQFAPFRRFCRTRKLVYAQYTRVFETCKEPQKSIKFSPFYRGRGPQKILLYFWGEGANEQKTNKRKKEFVWSKARFATRTRLRTNPSRTPKIHQNSDFLGLGTPRDNVYTWGKEQCATHLLEGFTLMPLTMICLRRDIVFDSDFALQ